MTQKGSKAKIYMEAGFTSIDNRLMAKQDITIHQKVLLSQVVSMMNSTGRYNASNDYITAVTGFNKKTIGKAFKVFNERGWLNCVTIPGGGRWVYFNQEHKTKLNDYLGTVAEYKELLQALKKYGVNNTSTPEQVELESTVKPEEKNSNNTPLKSVSSDKPLLVINESLKEDETVESANGQYKHSLNSPGKEGETLNLECGDGDGPYIVLFGDEPLEAFSSIELVMKWLIKQNQYIGQDVVSHNIQQDGEVEWDTSLNGINGTIKVKREILKRRSA